MCEKSRRQIIKLSFTSTFTSILEVSIQIFASKGDPLLGAMLGHWPTSGSFGSIFKGGKEEVGPMAQRR